LTCPRIPLVGISNILPILTHTKTQDSRPKIQDPVRKRKARFSLGKLFFLKIRLQRCKFLINEQAKTSLINCGGFDCLKPCYVDSEMATGSYTENM